MAISAAALAALIASAAESSAAGFLAASYAVSVLDAGGIVADAITAFTNLFETCYTSGPSEFVTTAQGLRDWIAGHMAAVQADQADALAVIASFANALRDRITDIAYAPEEIWDPVPTASPGTASALAQALDILNVQCVSVADAP